MTVTPDELLNETYALMRQYACTDTRKGVHVPPALAGIVTSPFNPPELHIYELLDARQAPHRMRALVTTDPSIFGFVFITMGSALYEQAGGAPPAVYDALLCLWCTAHAAGGDSFRIRHSPMYGTLLDPPDPLPDALYDLYRSVFDPGATLPTMLTPTPH